MSDHENTTTTTAVLVGMCAGSGWKTGFAAPAGAAPRAWLMAVSTDGRRAAKETMWISRLGSRDRRECRMDRKTLAAPSSALVRIRMRRGGIGGRYPREGKGAEVEDTVQGCGFRGECAI